MKFLPLLVWLSAMVSTASGLSLTNRIRFTNQHVDVRVVWRPETTNALSLRIHDGDLATNHVATNVVLVAVESSRLTLPDGFEEFGPAGAPFWVLPQSQDPSLLYAGFSGEGLPRDVFENPVNVRLRSVNGPGDFFVWQAGEFGSLDIVFNSRDGIGDNDAIPVLLGGHGHYNFGFTTNGLYEIVLQPLARPLGSSTNLPGEEVTLLFAVEPLPTNSPPELTLWERWQLENWPSTNDPAVIGPYEDPDHDGVDNVQEFVTGTNPTAPSGAASFSNLSVLWAGAGTVRLDLPVRIERLDSVSVLLEWSDSPSGPWSPAPTFDLDGAVLRLEETLPAAPATRFYRLNSSLRQTSTSLPP